MSWLRCQAGLLGTVADICLVTLLLIVGSCSSDSQGVDARRCSGARNSPTDVAHEPKPDFRKSDGYRTWTTRAGCLVRLDVVADWNGPSHCNYQDARVIQLGRPVGATFSSLPESATYVHDPEGAFDDPALSAAYAGTATLARKAVDSGFRQGPIELWTVPQDQRSIYLRTGKTTERWPLGKVPICA